MTGKSHGEEHFPVGRATSHRPNQSGVPESAAGSDAQSRATTGNSLQIGQEEAGTRLQGFSEGRTESGHRAATCRSHRRLQVATATEALLVEIVEARNRQWGTNPTVAYHALPMLVQSRPDPEESTAYARREWALTVAAAALAAFEAVNFEAREFGR